MKDYIIEQKYDCCFFPQHAVDDTIELLKTKLEGYVFPSIEAAQAFIEERNLNPLPLKKG